MVFPCFLARSQEHAHGKIGVFLRGNAAKTRLVFFCQGPPGYGQDNPRLTPNTISDETNQPPFRSVQSAPGTRAKRRGLASKQTDRFEWCPRVVRGRGGGILAKFFWTVWKGMGASSRRLGQTRYYHV